MSKYAIAANQNDCDARFYIPSDSTEDARSLGYADQRGPNSDFLMRMTPGTVNLTKGEPVNFIVHVKALRDFEGLNSLVLKLEPVLGRGTANFVQPDTRSVPGQPDVRLDGERIVITMKRTDKAARVIVHTDYPLDWWAGFSKVSVGAQTIQGAPQPSIFVKTVEGNVVVNGSHPRDLETTGLMSNPG